MYLKRLEIQGFKSFASATALDFLSPANGRNSITAVVGPNGAGKSNIADAIKWVMGETSLKAIRSKKSEDVIFHGSDSKRQVGAAEVTMVLDNSEGRIKSTTNEEDEIALDLPEITLTRRLYRSGESEYLVNNKQVRLLDIHLLLAKLHFAQHAYSIISQGMIDRLLAVTPSERKDFFDEASGIKEYQIKRHQSQLKLTRTEENISQAEALLQEVTPRMRLLARQVRKLAKRQEVETKLVEAQERFYSILYGRNKVELDRLQEALGKTEAKYRTAFKVLEAVQEELSGLARGATRQEAFNELQAKHSEATRELNELEKQVVILEGQLKTEYSQRGEQSVGWLTNKIADLKKNEQKLREGKARAATEKEANEKRAAEQRKVLAELNRESTELKVNVSRLRNLQPIERSEHNLLSFTGTEATSIFSKAKEKLGQVAGLLAVFNQETKNYDVELLGENEIPERTRPDKELTFSARLSTASAEQAAEHQANLKLANEELTTLEKRISANQDRLVELEVAARSSAERLRILDEEHTGVAGELASLEQELKLVQTSPSQFSKELAELSGQKEKLLVKIEDQREVIKKAEMELRNFNTQEEKKKEKVFQLQEELQKNQSIVNSILSERSEFNIELAKFETKQEDLGREVDTEMNTSIQSIVERLGPIETTKDNEGSELKDNIQKLKYQLSLIGGIDEETIEEHAQTKERYDFLTSQLKDLRAATSDLNEMIGELDELMKKKRSVAFKKIKKEFNRYFQVLFDGGKADLEEVYGEVLVEEEEIEEENPEEELEIQPETKKEKILTGIDVIASPPGKKVKYLNMLSGGERTLTSIALICAILHINPAPFVVLDEVEAALDEANTQRFVKIIGELSHQSQFIIITHNRVTMHAADALYGVVMGPDGASKLLSVKLEEAEKYGEASNS